jgi:multisubunit Na+/H+ antiporter MnhB subunit
MNTFERLRLHRTRSGQAMPEYVIVLAIFSIVLVLGPNSPLEAIFNAFSDYYARFSYATSRP